LSEPIRDKAELQQFYDDPEVVATYLQRKALPLGAVLHARQVAFLNQVIARLRPARLLEVAPGPARLSAELRPVPLAVGLEFSPRMLAEARRRTRGWRFVRRFEPAPRQQLYAELRRVLKPGAHLVLDAQNRLVAGPHRAGHPHDYPVYDELWRREELVAELEGAGFAVRHLEGIMRRFAWQRRLQRLRRFRLGGPARLLIRALEWTPDGNPSTWMVLAQAKPA